MNSWWICQRQTLFPQIPIYTSTSNKMKKKLSHGKNCDLSNDYESDVETPMDNHKKSLRKVYNKTSIEQKVRKRLRNPNKVLFYS